MNTIRPDQTSADLRGYIASVQEVTEAKLTALESAVNALKGDPGFHADFLKSRFVQSILEVLAETGESQSQLAQRWGKTRQYVSQLFNENSRLNFTIETMAELGHLSQRFEEVNAGDFSGRARHSR